MERFFDRLSEMEPGYQTGTFDGRTYAVTIEKSADGRRVKLFAEELGGSDRVSFNLYLLDGKPPLLKPCEMPQEKVVEFVLGYEADTDRA